jgi:hypothetical protein
MRVFTSNVYDAHAFEFHAPRANLAVVHITTIAVIAFDHYPQSTKFSNGATE